MRRRVVNDHVTNSKVESWSLRRVICKCNRRDRATSFISINCGKVIEVPTRTGGMGCKFWYVAREGNIFHGVWGKMEGEMRRYSWSTDECVS